MAYLPIIHYYEVGEMLDRKLNDATARFFVGFGVNGGEGRFRNAA